jgi:transcriptional regulator with XRE-family HTH domain
MAVTQEPVGTQLRRWRQRRHRSQLDVSIGADLSTRHLSFIETGRSTPSRGMIERLCEELDVPLGERNRLHLAAGFAPVHQERPLAELGEARAAVEAVLNGHDPYPAVAVNVRWDLLAANRAMTLFLSDLPRGARQEPLNLLRATLHPDGLAPRVRNYEQWRQHVVRRIRRQLERTAAAGLATLLTEVEGYPAPAGATGQEELHRSATDVSMPLILSTDHGDLSLCYVLSVFGAPRDVTLDEIAVESFFPADETSRDLLQQISRPPSEPPS